MSESTPHPDHPEQAIGGQTAAALSGFPTAALTTRELRFGSELAWQRRLRLVGPMAQFLRQAVQAATDESDVFGQPVLAEADRGRVLLFSVEALIGEELEIASPREVAPAVLCLVRRRMPGIDWQVLGDWASTVDKYQALNGSIPAPPHEHTGKPRAIEVYGRLIAAAGLAIDSAQGAAWLMAHRMWKSAESFGDAGAQVREQLEAQGYPKPAEPGTMRFRIEVATYSNLMYPGVGVPSGL